MKAGHIAASSWAAERLDIFARGTATDLFHIAWTGDSWSPGGTSWEALGGELISPPAVMSSGLDTLDIFGLGPGQEMFHKAWDGSEWQPSVSRWEALGGEFAVPCESGACGRIGLA